MSTYWYFECVDHDPPLRSEEEFTQHTDDAHFHAALELAASRPVHENNSYWALGPLTSDEERVRSYFSMNARRFLSKHPSCHLEVVSEYGDRRSISGD